MSHVLTACLIQATAQKMFEGKQMLSRCRLFLIYLLTLVLLCMRCSLNDLLSIIESTCPSPVFKNIQLQKSYLFNIFHHVISLYLRESILACTRRHLSKILKTLSVTPGIWVQQLQRNLGCILEFPRKTIKEYHLGTTPRDTNLTNLNHDPQLILIFHHAAVCLKSLTVILMCVQA